MKKCKHKPERLFSWIVQCIIEGTVLCVGCCDCGESWTIPMKRKPARGANLLEVRPPSDCAGER